MGLFEFKLDDTVIYFNKREFEKEGRTALRWDDLLCIEGMLTDKYSAFEELFLIHWKDRKGEIIKNWNRKMINRFKKSFTKYYGYKISIRKNIIYKLGVSPKGKIF